MAELSSNWKKLQEKIKAESATPRPQKRKAEAQLQPQSIGKKFARGAPKHAGPRSHPIPIDRSSQHKMGAVQSSVPVLKAKSSISPSFSLWAQGSQATAEAFAEAYDLGIKGGPTVLDAGKDKVNHGFSGEIKIGKYIAMDCEMVGVGPGGHESALARVSLVDFYGQQVYDSYVKPKERVTDWRTAVSGISQKEMRFARSFEDVRQEVDGVLRERILIGHDIKHDLGALKLSHPARDIRDTAKYPAFRKYGNGRKPALRTLAREILGIEIQDRAHSSTEDARAAMLLFRKHKCGFDVDHAKRYAPAPSKGGKTKRR